MRLAAIAATWLMASAAAAGAQADLPLVPVQAERERAPVTDEGGGRLESWPWAVSVPLLAGALVLEATTRPSEARWNNEGPVDRAFGGWIRDTRAGRSRADLASDLFLYAMFAAPVIDAIAWRTGVSPSRDTYRLLAGDTLAFAAETFLVVATKNGFRRARPFDRGCREDEQYDPGCGSDSRYRAFISGHTAAAFTGASLVCAHQRLRGQSALGRIECVGSLLLASLTGALRIVGAKHYASDVAVGAVIGFLSGFILPVFVYPRHLPQRPAPRTTATLW